jgi:hypothetical protein
MTFVAFVIVLVGLGLLEIGQPILGYANLALAAVFVGCVIFPPGVLGRGAPLKRDWATDGDQREKTKVTLELFWGLLALAGFLTLLIGTGIVK